jgi:hypothetical protein
MNPSKRFQLPPSFPLQFPSIFNLCLTATHSFFPHVSPHQICDPENQRESDIRRMADARKQAAQASRLVRERLVQPLNVVINLLDAENLGKIHEKTAKGNDAPQDGVSDGEDPPDGREVRCRDVPQRPLVDERPTLHQLLK